MFGFLSEIRANANAISALWGAVKDSHKATTDKLEMIRRESGELQEELLKTRNELAEAKKKVDETDAELRRTARKLTDRDHRIADMESDINDLRKQFHLLTQTVGEKLKAVDEVIDNYGEASKIAVKTEKDWNEGLQNILNFDGNTVPKKGNKT